jgi:hypothetical protein
MMEPSVTVEVIVVTFLQSRDCYWRELQHKTGIVRGTHFRLGTIRTMPGDEMVRTGAMVADI